ncbi:MAG: NPCBM/NEW2 domain-containing protein [Phycisphaerae bacterium]|nr:NPCBM/NEW2 domain-containing protein [Phycisphaerae bacterium]
MSCAGQIPPDFAEWVIRSFDGTIAPEQFTQLDHEIATNDKARAYYLEIITTHVGLVDLMGGLPRAETLMDAECGVTEATGALRVEPETPGAERIREIERFASQQLAEFLAQQQRERLESKSAGTGWDLWAAIEGAAHTVQRAAAAGAKLVKAAAICLLVLGALSIVGLYLYANRTLGVLAGSADAKWDVPIEPTGQLRVGRRTLEEGYARIRLQKGAEVLVQAPSTFDLRTTNRMFLESGWITAAVPPAATGFVVRTPGSSVVDFGTEFGLLAGDAGNTEIHVFDGRIEFEHLGGAVAAGARQRLVKDEAITVDAEGRATRVPLRDRPRLFSRTMPAAGGFGIPGKRLSLADMVGAGNGLDTGVWGQGLDASTGRFFSGRKVLKRDDNGFQSVPSLPFVDGVFVPDSNDGAAVVTSTGINFDECPKTCGKSYETIINGAIFESGSLGAQFGRLAGRTYNTGANPSIGMHPNAGITFDLDAIRHAMPGVEIDRFVALCGVSESVVPFCRGRDPADIKVDFWVLVDGRVHFHANLAAAPSQSGRIDMRLGPNDRFLTLVTTHPGDYQYGWALFAEPALELTREKHAAIGATTR